MLPDMFEHTGPHGNLTLGLHIARGLITARVVAIALERAMVRTLLKVCIVNRGPMAVPVTQPLSLGLDVSIT